MNIQGKANDWLVNIHGKTNDRLVNIKGKPNAWLLNIQGKANAWLLNIQDKANDWLLNIREPKFHPHRHLTCFFKGGIIYWLGFANIDGGYKILLYSDGGRRFIKSYPSLMGGGGKKIHFWGYFPENSLNLFLLVHE